jgi:hypothetical protein
MHADKEKGKLVYNDTEELQDRDSFKMPNKGQNFTFLAIECVSYSSLI